MDLLRTRGVLRDLDGHDLVHSGKSDPGKECFEYSLSLTGKRVCKALLTRLRKPAAARAAAAPQALGKLLDERYQCTLIANPPTCTTKSTGCPNKTSSLRNAKRKPVTLR